MKKLGKSQTSKVISGVCAGVAEYFNVDATIVRMLWILFTFAGGSGILLYIICAIFMPTANYNYNTPSTVHIRLIQHI